MTLLWLAMACGPKQPVQEAPIVGWHQEETWTLACFHPPQYDTMLEMERRDSWQGSMDAMLQQWGGQRGDGISVDENTLDQIDFQFSAYPKKVEQVSQENLEKCRQVATGQLPKDDWHTWIKGLPSQLTAGECRTHFLDTVMDTDFSIVSNFDNSFPVCEGDKLRIFGSTSDQFRISPDGEWISIAGDQNNSSLGKENYPCNIEGCFDGMLILRFTDTDDRVTIHPVGAEFHFKAPRDGYVSYGINEPEDMLYDNQWYQSGGLIDHTAVTLSPVE